VLRGHLEEDEKDDFAQHISMAAAKESARHLLKRWHVGLEEEGHAPVEKEQEEDTLLNPESDSLYSHANRDMEAYNFHRRLAEPKKSPTSPNDICDLFKKWIGNWKKEKQQEEQDLASVCTAFLPCLLFVNTISHWLCPSCSRTDFVKMNSTS